MFNKAIKILGKTINNSLTGSLSSLKLYSLRTIINTILLIKTNSTNNIYSTFGKTIKG